ncbi:MAG: DUF5110 domain-containing protein [Candidatus Eisenbacteria bacterium]|nr:DUF5110 domain-containing protein [Candidatus Eisenbacteria bacterium]
MRWNRPDEVHRGPVTLRDYPVPLAELPVFLRAGAIIPQWPSMLHVEERAVEQIEFLIWPSDRSSFDLYEDDGVTRDYQRGRSATTRITAERFPGGVQVRFHPRQGAFEIGPREHRLRLLRTEAETVTLDGVELSRCADLESLSASAAGWCIEAGGAITQIKYRSEGRGEVIAVFEAGAEPLISGAAAVHPQPQRAGQPIQFYLPDAPGAEITLLDAAGRRCSVLRADRDGKATWSGLRDDGAALPAGVYLYLARGPRGPLRGKITLLP